MPRRTYATFLVVLPVLAACISREPAAPERRPVASAADPDPSVSFVVAADPRFAPQPELAAPLGAAQVFGVAGTATRITMSFVPRTDTPQHRDLDSYVAHARAEFESVVRDREIAPLSLSTEQHPLRAAALPSRALSFVTVQKPGAPPPTSVCDAAGLYVETPRGFWTFSWNADRGQLAAATRHFEDFLATIEVRRRA